MSIDWSKAPEGATHYSAITGTYYSYAGGLVHFKDGRWEKSGGCFQEMQRSVGVIVRPTSTVIPVDQPKQLDRSVFDGLPPEYRWAAISSDGRAHAHKCTPKGATGAYWLCVRGCAAYLIGEGYDTADWQNSLIRRDRCNGCPNKTDGVCCGEVR